MVFRNIQRIVALARLIVLDGMRSHAVIGLLCLALMCEIAGLFFFEFIPRDIGRVSSDFIFTISLFSGFVFLFFYAIQVASWSDDKRLIHTFLARPLSRFEYVIGCFVGLVVLLLTLNFLLCLTGLGVLMMIKSQIDTSYFSSFSLGYYLWAWFGVFCIEFTLLSIILLFSSAIRGSLMVLILSISYYLICTGLPVVRQAVLDAPRETEKFIFSLLMFLSILFPDLTRLDFKSIVMSQTAAPWGEMFVSCGLIFSYITVTLCLACFIYSRKDLR